MSVSFPPSFTFSAGGVTGWEGSLTLACDGGAACCATAEWVVRSPTPRRDRLSTSRIVVTPFSLLINMAFSTPSVRAATLTEIPPAAACPAANRLAALLKEDTTEDGTPADATFCASTAAHAPPDSTTP